MDEMETDKFINYITELISYIAIIGEELDNTATLAYLHGWRSSRVEEGEKARERLDKLAEELSLPPFTEMLKLYKEDK